VERRLVYILPSEAALRWREGVVRSARDGDLGAICGIGYPPSAAGRFVTSTPWEPARWCAGSRR
jgi:hypothetical protein